MRVLNIGVSEMGYIKEGLKLLEERKRGSYSVAKCMHLPQEEVSKAEYELSQVRTTGRLLEDMRLQELCERCLSYFWDMYEDMGCFSDQLEELMDDIGLDEAELKMLFNEAGFEEE